MWGLEDMLIEDIENTDRFLFIFEWLMAIMSRYLCPMPFGLVHIEHGDKNELGDAYGAKEAAEQLVSMTTHLKKAFEIRIWSLGLEVAFGLLCRIRQPLKRFRIKCEASFVILSMKA